MRGSNKSRSSGPRHFKPKPSAVKRPVKTLSIDSWSADGRGVGRDNDGVTFVADALPGEVVQAQVVQSRNRFSEAELVSVVTPSAARVTPACPHYALCGGCNAQHITHREQVSLKQAAALDQLQRLGGVTPEQVLPPIMSAPWGYRQRCRLSVWYNAYKGRVTVQLGFRAKRSKDIVDVLECGVLSPSLAKLIRPLRQWLQACCSESRAISHIELVATNTKPVIILRSVAPLSNGAKAGLLQCLDEIVADCWLKPSKDAQLFDLDDRKVDPRYRYTLAEQGIEVGFHPLDFTQVNWQVNQQLVTLAIELLQPTTKDRILDLYCGVGNFGLPLAKLARQVVGVEVDESMVVRGRQNAEQLSLNNLTFIAEDLSVGPKQPSWHKAGIDLALLDPPRSGAAQAVEYLLNLAPRTLVYVSCNPATFARDASELVKGGYRMTHFGVLDMFPQTAHIEAIARFSR